MSSAKMGPFCPGEDELTDLPCLVPEHQQTKLTSTHPPFWQSYQVISNHNPDPIPPISAHTPVIHIPEAVVLAKDAPFRSAQVICSTLTWESTWTMELRWAIIQVFKLYQARQSTCIPSRSQGFKWYCIAQSVTDVVKTYKVFTSKQLHMVSIVISKLTHEMFNPLYLWLRPTTYPWWY